MELVKFIAIIATPIVIGTGFWFTRRQLQSGRNARMASIVVALQNSWNSEEMKKSRCQVSELGNGLKAAIVTADNDNSPDLCVLVDVGNFFDHLGVLVMHGLLDKAIAYDFFWRAEEHYYQLYRTVLEDPSYKDYLESFSKLHRVFEKEKARRHKDEPRPSV